MDGNVLHKKHRGKTFAPAMPDAKQDPPAETSPAIPAGSGNVPPNTPAGSAGAQPPIALKAGPGRPPSKPQCVKCGKRLKRCSCKGGSVLTGEVEKAVAEQRKKAAAPPLTEDEAETIVRFLCWIFGVVESAAAALLSELTWNEAEEIWSFSEEDVRSILPPSKKILAKYAVKLPAWLRYYGDEMAFLQAFFSMEQKKLQRSAETIEKRHSGKLGKPELVKAPAGDLAKAVAQ